MFRDEVIDVIKKALAVREEPFFSEAELQLYIARKLEDYKKIRQVYLEYAVPIDTELRTKHCWPWTGTTAYIDIVVENEDKFLPIEIKYKTASLETKHSVFGEKQAMHLRQQSAQGNGCYDFWKDVRRLELLRNRYKNKIVQGITLFVTNDHLYWYGAKPDNARIQYAQFSLRDRLVAGPKTLDWNNGKNHGGRIHPIKLANSYAINWIDWLKGDEMIEDSQFRYLIL